MRRSSRPTGVPIPKPLPRPGLMSFRMNVPAAVPSLVHTSSPFVSSAGSVMRSRGLAGRGAKLVLSGRQTEVLGRLERELDAQVFAVDLADRRALQHLCAAHVIERPIGGEELEKVRVRVSVNLRDTPFMPPMKTGCPGGIDGAVC